MDVILEAPDAFLAGADAAAKRCGREATLLGGKNTRVFALNGGVGLRAMAGREACDHPRKGLRRVPARLNIQANVVDVVGVLGR